MVKGGTDKRKDRGKRRKKRGFCGNQHTKKQKQNENDEQQSINNDVDLAVLSCSYTVSEAKLSKQMPVIPPLNDERVTGMRFMDMELLGEVFEMLPCPECKQPMLELVEEKRYGLACEMCIRCLGCAWEHSFLNTKKTERSYQINRRVFYSMRRVGGGYQSLKKFLYLMNHPPPMTEKNYRKVTTVFNNKVKEVANTIMNEAAQELHVHEPANNNNAVSDVGVAVSDVGVSLDGTWQKRGHTSLNGAVATLSIDTGRVVDIDVMSRYCQRCINNKNSPHVCSINHEGSAPKMEQSGVVRIFERSIEKNELRYTEYYGDGDTKSHSAVKDIYKEIEVVKKECIGHIQKRVGKRLRDLKKKEKGLGKQGLNDAMIDRLQNYYGMAVRGNVGNLQDMKTAIYAGLMHVCSSKANNYHWKYCPPGSDSWCSYQRDIANHTNLHVPGYGLSVPVMLHVKKIFLNLSSDALLSRCLHGKTQNQNESFNATIWNRIPKHRFVKLQTFEIGTYDAVAHFNIGNSATLRIYDAVGLERGFWTLKGCADDDEYRKSNSRRQSSNTMKINRRKSRGLKKMKSVKNRKKEGKVYGAGMAP